MPSEIDENRVREIIREELGELLKSDRYTFLKLLNILDGRNIQLGRVTGTKIGTNVSELLAFHNSTPIAQAANANQAAVTQLNITGTDTISASNVDTNFSRVITLLNRLRLDLVNKGIIKGSA